jgi:uroporphyrinogen decarboxylase
MHNPDQAVHRAPADPGHAGAMDPRHALLATYRRQGCPAVPLWFELCPALQERCRAETGDDRPYQEVFAFPWRQLRPQPAASPQHEAARLYPGQAFAPGTRIDQWGVAHEPGSDAAHHMTRMHHPLAGADRAGLAAHPLPQWSGQPSAGLCAEVAALHARGLAAEGYVGNAVWEHAWYLRGMDRLCADFAEDEEAATLLLDRIAATATARATALARAGCDIIFLGDDIGTQSRLMLSPATWRRWLRPRLAAVIAAARAVNPALLVRYHSCGYVEPLIPELIACGVDILNPVQPESMDFAALHRRFGRDLSFHGTIGTQTTMPFGSPEEVRSAVRRNLAIAGPLGGLVCCPTHLLEPEVPWANIAAYAEACRAF